MTDPAPKFAVPARLPIATAAATLACAPSTAWRLGEIERNFRVFRIGKKRYAEVTSFGEYCARLRGQTTAAAA